MTMHTPGRAPMHHRSISLAGAMLLTLMTSLGSAAAPSTDRDRPTPSRAPAAASADGSPRRGSSHSVLMWSESGNVYALHGPGSGWQVADMAQTLR